MYRDEQYHYDQQQLEKDRKAEQRQRRRDKYAELLDTPEWRARRYQILVRDEYMCQECESKIMPQVHHKYYAELDRAPWGYPDSALVTLCRKCHSKAHRSRIKHLSNKEIDQLEEQYQYRVDKKAKMEKNPELYDEKGRYIPDKDSSFMQALMIIFGVALTIAFIAGSAGSIYALWIIPVWIVIILLTKLD